MKNNNKEKIQEIMNQISLEREYRNKITQKALKENDTVNNNFGFVNIIPISIILIIVTILLIILL